MDFIALIKTADAVDIVAFPFLVMGDGIKCRGELMGETTMGLKVILIDDIDAELIRHFEQ